MTKPAYWAFLYDSEKQALDQYEARVHELARDLANARAEKRALVNRATQRIQRRKEGRS